MTRLPPAIVRRLEITLQRTVDDASPVGGGCINQAARVEADGLTLFVKWRRGAPPGFFGAEADGLRRLRETATVRVPPVLSSSDEPGAAHIALGWVEPGQDRRASMADAGRRLALLHGQRGRAPGLERDNFIGTLPQGNGASRTSSWRQFFRDKRLLALADPLPSTTRQRLERLPIGRLLDEPEGGCALLHGDLWGGNALVGSDGQGWVVDPAVYAGHPEVDLAMTRLFGGFDGAFYDAYQEVAGRFDRDLEARLDILNLYPLLVHVHLFGGGYLRQVDAILSRFVR